MTHSQNPEELAFQKSMIALNNIRHGINFVSDKAFAENLINETNKSRRTDIEDGERTKYLLIALLDRIKSRPESTFSTLVRILKETNGIDFVGEELQKNLEKVRMELAVQGVSHQVSPGSYSITRSGNILLPQCGGMHFIPGVPKVTPFTKQTEQGDLITLPPTTHLSLHARTLATPTTTSAMPISSHHDPAAQSVDWLSKGPVNIPEDRVVVQSPKTETSSDPSPFLVTGQTSSNTSLIDPRTNLPDPVSHYGRSISQCSTDTDSDNYTTPQQSLDESMAEKLFQNISRRTLCKESLLQKTQVLHYQQEIRRLKAKLQAQDEIMLDQAEALKEEIVQSELQCRTLKETCDNAVSFMQELEEKVSTLAETVESKELERQEAWRYYEVSTNLLLRNLTQQACGNDTTSNAHERLSGGRVGEGNFRTERTHFRSQKVTEMLNSCSMLMLPRTISEKRDNS